MTEMLNVMVLACGASTRFPSHTIPKQFIEFPVYPDATPRQMWRNTIAGLREQVRVHLITLKDFHLMVDPGDANVVCLDMSRGQAETVYFGLLRIRPVPRGRDPVLIVNCDNGFAPGLLDKLLTEGRFQNIPAALTFQQTGRRWSYVDGHPTFGSAIEKPSADFGQTHALAGAYYFPDVDELTKQLGWNMRRMYPENQGEPYLSQVYRHIPGLKWSCEVRRDDVYDWGTEKSLGDFIRYEVRP